MHRHFRGLAIAALCVSALLPASGRAAGYENAAIEQVVAQAVRPMMRRFGIPGMAVGVITSGHGYVYSYGVASNATGRPVKRQTLFEIGSVSKALTATLAACAQVRGDLSLSDSATKDLPSLRGSSFDAVSLIELGTHTAGGLPLQVPDDVANDAELMTYFQRWKPAYAPGTYRLYSNPSIGLLGMIAARSMNASFATLMEGTLFPALGMKSTYLDVPSARMADYAQGYTKTGAPIRMAPGVLAPETYGVRTTAGDLLRFVKANMRMLSLDPALQRAITDTHTGYFRIGAMTQDLVWEQYDYPAALSVVLAGNSDKILRQANPAARIDPPAPPRDDVLIDKTGATNGFSAYVAYVPGRRIGVVLLANRSYPDDAEVTAAYGILSRLGHQPPAGRQPEAPRQIN